MGYLLAIFLYFCLSVISLEKGHNVMSGLFINLTPFVPLPLIRGSEGTAPLQGEA